MAERDLLDVRVNVRHGEPRLRLFRRFRHRLFVDRFVDHGRRERGRIRVRLRL